MAIAVRGIVLPEREERVLSIAGDRLRVGAAAGDEFVVDGGWLIPGLVDAHTHPGTEKPGDPFEDDLFRRHMIEHRDAGVLLVRAPGLAGVAQDADDLPRMVSAGQWLATPGKFYPDFGRHLEESELVAAAVEDALGGSGWCKIIGDWWPGDPAVPAELLATAVSAVHAVGGRVAVHCQTADGCRNAVMAGADSLEHGMYLDHSLLPQMADQGTVLVPTLTTFSEIVEKLKADPREHFREWLTAGFEGQFETIRAAHAAGVTVLAGTDCHPFGRVTEEIEWLIRAGMPVEAAVGAGSWTARTWLGLDGLVAGSFADVVAYDKDPTKDPTTLTRPKRVILRGRVIR